MHYSPELLGKLRAYEALAGHCDSLRLLREAEPRNWVSEKHGPAFELGEVW